MADTSIPVTGSVGGQGSGADGVSLNIPKKSAHDVYLINVMSCLGTHRQVMSQVQSGTDPVVVSSTRECVACIVDSRIRHDLMEAYELGLKKIYNLQGVDLQTKGNLIIRLSQNVIGEVYDFCDQFVGLVRLNVIAPVFAPPPEKEDVKDGDSVQDMSDEELAEAGIPDGDE